MNEGQLIYDFTTIAMNTGGWMALDRDFIQNKISGLLSSECQVQSELGKNSQKSSVELCEELVTLAVKRDETLDEDDLFCKLMDIATPPPSVVNALFAKQYEDSAKDALDYLNLLSVGNDFILNTDSSKELSVSSKCPLCFNHEGINGGRYSELPLTRRFIRLNLDGESYGFQLSRIPKSKGEGLFFSEEHVLIHLTSSLMKNLCQLLDLFPDYGLLASSVLEKNGHGYIKATVKKEDTQSSYSASLPFFKQTYFNTELKHKNKIQLLVTSYDELPLVFDYLLALSKNIDELNNKCRIYCEKSQRGYHVTIEPNELADEAFISFFEEWTKMIDQEVEEIV